MEKIELRAEHQQQKPNLAARQKHKSAALHIPAPVVEDEAERKRWHGLPPRKVVQLLWRPEEPRL